jgi:membrane protease YdiL (CAAX protease family)
MSILKRFTTEQWDEIDRQYLRPGAPRAHAASVLVTAAIALVLPRFFGRHSDFEELPGVEHILALLPYPNLLPHLYWAAFKLVNYGLLPLLCVKLVLARDLLDFGLRPQRERRVWLLYAGMLLLVLPLAYAASFTDAFAATYPKYRGAGNSWTELLLWEAAYGFQFLMLEFFFRGFLLFSLARHMGSLAIFVMVVPYAMIHLGKPMAECFGSILAGIALGTIALRSGSIYGGVLVHCGVAWAMDLFALARSGGLGRLMTGAP